MILQDSYVRITPFTIDSYLFAAGTEREQREILRLVRYSYQTFKGVKDVTVLAVLLKSKHHLPGSELPQRRQYCPINYAAHWVD